MAADRTPALRPLSVGDVLDELFALYRRHFKTYVGIAALVHVPLALLALPLSAGSSDFVQRFGGRVADPSEALAAFGQWMVPLLLLLIPLFIVGTVLELAATCVVTADFYLGRQPT